MSESEKGSRIFLKGGTLLSPLPAVLVSCGSAAEGERKNVLTVAWTGIINTRPPMVYISLRPERYSYGIIRERGEFVINLTTSAMVKTVDFCGVKSGGKLDKIKHCGLHTEKAHELDCPVICESPLALECKVREIRELGSHHMFIADVVGATVDSRYVDSKGKINLQQAGLMTYSHGEYFSLGRKLGDFGYSVAKKGGKVCGKENKAKRSVRKNGGKNT
ncbi:MAG: flavin reductase family protein [Huintestinicola sp.]